MRPLSALPQKLCSYFYSVNSLHMLISLTNIQKKKEFKHNKDKMLVTQYINAQSFKYAQAVLNNLFYVRLTAAEHPMN